MKVAHLSDISFLDVISSYDFYFLLDLHYFLFYSEDSFLVLPIPLFILSGSCVPRRRFIVFVCFRAALPVAAFCFPYICTFLFFNPGWIFLPLSFTVSVFLSFFRLYLS